METQTERPREKSSEEPLTQILGDITSNAKDLAVEQGRLVKAEINATIREVGEDLAGLIIFGGLTVLAALPLMMFFIFGLGDLLEGRYWLSSLIVTVVWGGGAGLLAYRQYKKLSRTKPTLPSTRRALDRSTETVKESVEEVKDAIGQTIQ